MNNPDILESELEQLPKYEEPPAYKKEEEESQRSYLPPQLDLSQEHRQEV
jgi:hypothetical protein